MLACISGAYDFSHLKHVSCKMPGNLTPLVFSHGNIQVLFLLWLYFWAWGHVSSPWLSVLVPTLSASILAGMGAVDPKSSIHRDIVANGMPNQCLYFFQVAISRQAIRKAVPASWNGREFCMQRTPRPIAENQGVRLLSIIIFFLKEEQHHWRSPSNSCGDIYRFLEPEENLKCIGGISSSK